MTRQQGLTMIATHPSQARLAASLIGSLGLEGAIAACRANAWDGVLECVLAYRAGARRPVS
jgi:hypothetical protein